MDYTVEISNLCIGYDKKALYTNLNGRLRKGELTCLLGKNGTGKSTLLKSMCGILPTIAGEVRLQGRSIAQYSSAEIARTVSIVLTETVRAEEMTVYDVVALGRSPYTGFFGRLSREDERIIADSFRLTETEEFRDRRITTLSDGERQKVMIAKAVVQETPIILLDEPSAFLDYPSKIRLMQLLRKLARELGKTILLSTHDLEHALQLSDNVWLMDKDLGLAQGTTEEVCRNGLVEQYFEMEGIRFDREARRFVV